MVKGKELSCKEKELVVSTVSFFRNTNETIKRNIAPLSREKQKSIRNMLQSMGINPTNPAKLAAQTLGIGKRSVQRYLDRERQGTLSVNLKKNCGRKKIVVDSFTEGVIRRKILDAYSNKKYLNSRNLHASLQDDPNFPVMGRRTLLDIMRRQLKFKYMKFHCKPVPFERQDITADRHTYIRRIRYLRKCGYQIFYQDESWVNESQAPVKGWHMPEKEVVGMGGVGNQVDVWLKGVGRRFTENLLGGVTGKPSGAGKRLIMIAIGSEEGFLKGGWKVFQGKKGKNPDDYHSEMNSAHFFEWLKDVIDLLPEKSVVVLDRASYHRNIVESSKNPTTAWRKADLVKWMEDNNIKLPEEYESFSDMTCPVLRELAKKHRIQEIFVAEELAKNSGKDIRIIWMPVAHCELNPIELIWSRVKWTVAQNNTTFKVKDVERLTKSAMEEVTSELWSKCVDHVKTLEQLFVDKEHIVDEFFAAPHQQIIVNLEESDSDNDSVNSDDEIESEEGNDDYGSDDEEDLLPI